MSALIHRVEQTEFFADVCELEHEPPQSSWTRTKLASCWTPVYLRALLLIDQRVHGYYLAHQVLDELSLLNITIAQNYRGRGYGRALLLDLISRAEHLQCKTIWLEVRCSNDAAIKLYTRVGFTSVTIRKDYYPIPSRPSEREDAMVMMYRV